MVRAFVLAALFVLPGLPAPAATPRGALGAHVQSIIGMPQYKHSEFGLAVYDVRSGRSLYALNAERYFLAASTTKLLTEGAALSVLGPQFRFRTNVFRTGPVDSDGVLHGDLVLVASGDPNLSARLRSNDTLAYENEDHSYDGGADTKAVPGDPLLALHDFATQVAAFGITRVTGYVRVDDSLYKAGFAEAGTGAVVSPIMVNDNIVDVTVRPGANAGDPVTYTVSPQTAYVRFVNRATTGIAGTERHIALVEGDSASDGSQTVAITGTVPAGASPVLYAYDVPSPRRFAEMALTEELERTGIGVAQNPQDEPVVHPTESRVYNPQDIVATHLSAPLAEDVKVTLKVSDNLHADTMPYLWAHGNLAQAFALERAFLARGGLDPDQVVQNDGLGGDAFIQPSFMVRYLRYVAYQPFFKAFESALPIMGVDGTLYNIQRHSAAAGKVEAKTGTWSAGDALNHRQIVTAKGLAGYMTTRSGRRVAFCFYVNNLVVPHGRDAARIAGELLGRVATATYLYTP